MTLTYLLCLLVVAGVVIALVPMDPTLKKLVVVLIVLAVCVWILHYFGLFHGSFR